MHAHKYTHTHCHTCTNTYSQVETSNMSVESDEPDASCMHSEAEAIHDNLGELHVHKLAIYQNVVTDYSHDRSTLNDEMLATPR